MDRADIIPTLPAAAAHQPLARYLANFTSVSVDDAKAILSSAAAGDRIVIPPVAAWASDAPVWQAEAEKRRDGLRAIYGDRLDMSAAEEAPEASGISTTAVADGWAEAFGKTNARRADDPEPVANAGPAASMRAAMDEAIARLKGA